MTRLNLSLLLVLASALLFFSGCEDDDPVIENPEELITTVTLTLTPVGGGATASFEFRDLDGDGGDSPVISGATLASGTTYNASIALLNETESPAENITEEVSEEDDEHQLFYVPSAALNLSFVYDDADGDGNPVGILTTMTTGDASTGTLTVILRHEPDKGAAGVRNGDPANAGGETDIEVDFPVTIQ